MSRESRERKRDRRQQRQRAGAANHDLQRRADRQASKQRAVNGHPDGQWLGTQFGWCATRADLADCRTQTHDALIDQMGAARLGGVSWHQYEGHEAEAALEVLREDEGAPAVLDYLGQIEQLLRDKGGWLVIATAPGRKPE